MIEFSGRLFQKEHGQNKKNGRNGKSYCFLQQRQDGSEPRQRGGDGGYLDNESDVLFFVFLVGDPCDGGDVGGDGDKWHGNGPDFFKGYAVVTCCGDAKKEIQSAAEPHGDAASEAIVFQPHVVKSDSYEQDNENKQTVRIYV